MQVNAKVQSSSKHQASKLGDIPEGWKVVKFKEILKIGSGKDYKKLNLGSIPVYGTGGYMLSVDDYLYDGESVCIGRKGTIDKPLFITGKFWTVDTLFYTHSFENCNPKYIFNLFKTIPWKLYNEASSLPSLSKKTIENIKIKLPPLPEQQKIAQLLSTWDKAITLQDQLITQKQALKKGLMQQLLTGKKRFVGFEEDWEEGKIKDIATTFSGGTPSSKTIEYYDGNIPWIKSGELNKGIIKKTEGFISELGLNNSSAKLVKVDTILIAMYGATAGVCAITKVKGAINQAVLALVLNSEIDTFFTYQLLKIKMPNIVHRMVQGGQPNLSSGIINSIKIKLPKLEEQQKIAAILSSFDKEIEHLQQHKKAFIQQKQGLMQQLLSGEKRVKI
jgi:type I restriction enzyme S subunit